MVVEIVHQGHGYSIDEPRLQAYARWIMDRVGDLTPTLVWRELSVVLTDDRIRDLNRQWFDRDTVTDVISFAYPDDGTGEVIVNLEQAAGEGELRDSADEELALYLAHGCHHLTGATDDTPERKQAMLDLETRWVQEAGEAGLTGRLFR